MKKIFKDVEFYTYKHGFFYGHERGKYIFSFGGQLHRFNFGADWYFFNWKVQELNIYIGFFQLSWTRILP